jgi:dolichol-phosphate mannosyltransferase
MLTDNDFAEEVERQSVSVILPVYRCADCLEPLLARLEPILRNISDRFEVIFVDDRSPDNAWPLIQALRSRLPFVSAVRLSRNFGQQMAIRAGLSVAKGDIAIVMDCDLQDPPEFIPVIHAKLQEGHDLVLTRRRERSHGWLRVAAAHIYFRFLSLLAQVEIDGSYGSFSMLRRKVIDAYLNFSETSQHYIFVLRWLGFDAGILEYTQEGRAAGRSSYTFLALLRHALNGIFFQTAAMLRWIVGFGLFLALLGVAGGLFLIGRYIFIRPAPGWTSLAVLIIFSTGALLTGLGVIGIYIGNIFEQIKRRPLFVLDVVESRTETW